MLTVRALCRMLGNFISVLKDLIPEAISSQKSPINVGPILNRYRGMDI